ncbi:phosphoserine phosphatase SerB [Tessaracoccus sp. OH4464_COT-324]|uniref:phosphoserine phosphatase SerB n=1 Tax=Tessaracoccus sp. OH4464_COT-324 TaxID=2491059 RepID=UPI000F638209|nr:phosphoserine phosphatase SerB [Tessaracoccus sp. OH4464_COT-324]RRD47152.1 phosphoserine phosphatase SerB [Tessaracoccus sp. OH4464_COT-324]
MQIRVTLVSPNPIDDRLLDGVPAHSVTASEEPFGHVLHAFAKSDDPERLRRELTAHPLAVAVVDGPLAQQDAQLILCDVDSTLTTTEAIDLIAEHAGRGAEVAEITEAAMRGELDFEPSLRARVATLKGLPTRILDEVYPRMTLSPGARELVTAAHERGARFGVTSGGFSQLVGPLADELGLDFFSANELGVAVRDGVPTLTGEVVGAVVDRRRKARDLRDFARASGVRLERCVAVGDGANDVGMLAAAGLGIAYCAKPMAALQADVSIDFPRLDAVTAFAFPTGAGR